MTTMAECVLSGLRVTRHEVPGRGDLVEIDDGQYTGLMDADTWDEVIAAAEESACPGGDCDCYSQIWSGEAGLWTHGCDHGTGHERRDLAERGALAGVLSEGKALAPRPEEYEILDSETGEALPGVPSWGLLLASLRTHEGNVAVDDDMDPSTGAARRVYVAVRS